jgi:hypothetical protein
MKAWLLILLLLPTAALRAQLLPQHVVLVIIDGARYSETVGDPLGQYAPRMHALAGQGAVVDTFLNDSLTFTQRAIPAIWTGTWVAPVDTTVNGTATQYTRVPTMWEYFRKDLQRDSTDALYELKVLGSPWLPSYHPQYGPQYWPWYDMHDFSDPYVWQTARTRLATFHPTLSVLYLADVDHAGHLGVWQDYTRALTIADSIVGRLWDFLQSDPVYRNTTTMFVTNDHGRHADGTGTGFVGHGDGCPGCRRIELLAVGSGVRQTLSPVRRRIPDIVPTIGALLGYASPYSSGIAMTELLRPILSASPDTADVGDVPLYGTGSDSAFVYNSGGVNLSVNLVPDSMFSVSPVSAIIPPRQGRGFRVSWSPRSPGAHTGIIRILHNDPEGNDSIVVRGFATTRRTVGVALNVGWNLVSLPLAVENGSTDSVYPGAASPAYGFNVDAGYVETDSLRAGSGYWMKFPVAHVVPVTGNAETDDTVGVSAGWNLIGSIAFPVPADSVQTIPPGMTRSAFYRYTGTYLSADTLQPGQGYWVKADTAGSLVLRTLPPP